MCLKPCSAKLSRIVSRMGLPPTASRGFGRSSVSGNSRVPNPPAMSTTQFGRAVAPMSSLSVANPTTRPASSTKGRWWNTLRRMSASISSRDVNADTAVGRDVITSETGTWRLLPAKTARRMFPSVRMPSKRSSGPATSLPANLTHRSWRLHPLAMSQGKRLHSSSSLLLVFSRLACGATSHIHFLQKPGSKPHSARLPVTTQTFRLPVIAASPPVLRCSAR